MLTKRKLYFKVFSHIGAASIIFDVITPISHFSLHASIFLFLCFSASLLIWIIPESNQWVKARASIVWYWPIGSLLLTSAMLMMGVYIAGKNSPDGKGILAQHITALEELQLNLGFIKEDVQEIVTKTAVIDKKASFLEQEISKDPRKELSNMGIVWSVDAYNEAIRMCQLDVITLFLDGGMLPGANLLQEKRGTLWLMRQKKPEKYEVFDLLLSRGLDIDYEPRGYWGKETCIKDRMVADPLFLELLIKHRISRDEAVLYCDKGIDDIEKVYAGPCYKWPTSKDLPKTLHDKIIDEVVGPTRNASRYNSIRRMRMNGDDSGEARRLRALEDQNYDTICKNRVEMNLATEKERQERLGLFKQLKRKLMK